MTQLYGVLIVGVFCIVTSGIILFTLKVTLGLRVSKEEEIEGLDIHEHGMDAYPDFRMNDH
jgi:Amt family ammonium transporter